MDITPFLPIVSGFVGGAASAGVFQGPIKTLQDWWYINFGYELSEKAAILNETQAIKVELLRDSILNEASTILPENVQEPTLSILGPTLEASKYYIEEEELRDMFAKLIASSMDSSNNSIIHASFVEIIKQLSPLDAQNIASLFSTTSKDDAIVLLRKHVDSGGFVEDVKNIYLGNISCVDSSLISPSLENLRRLGLISIDYLSHKSGSSVYDIFKETNEYIDSIKEINAHNTIVDYNKSIDASIVAPRFTEVEIVKGKVALTDFGINFCQICL